MNNIKEFFKNIEGWSLCTLMSLILFALLLLLMLDTQSQINELRQAQKFQTLAIDKIIDGKLGTAEALNQFTKQ